MAAAKKEQTNIPADKLALYDKAVAGIPGLQRKGVTVPYTSCNGHMFSFLFPSGSLAIKLSDKDRSEFLKKYNTSPVISYGIALKEYVEVPAELLKKTKELKKYLTLSLEYVKSLKPKTTKKK